MQVTSTHLQSLDGYIWLATKDKMMQVPKDQADDVEMEDDDDDGDDDDDAEDETEFLPTLEVSVKPQEKERRRCKLSSERGNIPTSRTP